jgi:hypothetical protein
MKCIIQLDENGNYLNHPQLLDNFIQAFPDIDISGDNPPEGWAWFIRKNKLYETANTTISMNQVIDIRYSKLDENTYQDEFYVRDMTQSELDERIQTVKSNPPFSSWTLETDTYYWIPPIPKPQKSVYWDASTKSWEPLSENTPRDIFTTLSISGKIPSTLTKLNILTISDLTANTSNT